MAAILKTKFQFSTVYNVTQRTFMRSVIQLRDSIGKGGQSAKDPDAPFTSQDGRQYAENVRWPQEPRVGYAVLDFSQGTPFQYENQGAHLDGAEVDVQYMTVDNRQNNLSVTVTIDSGAVAYKRTTGPGGFKTFPVPSLKPVKLQFDSAGNGKCSVFVWNFDVGEESELIDRDSDIVTHSLYVTVVGPTTIWTPAAGKRFRMLNYAIEATGNLSIAAGATIRAKLQDNGADILGQFQDFWAPAAAAFVPQYPPAVDLEGGYSSVLVNNPLQLLLSAVPVTGEIGVHVVGMEF